MGAGVAAGELGQRGVAVGERAGRAEPVVRERVGRLAAAPGAPRSRGPRARRSSRGGWAPAGRRRAGGRRRGRASAISWRVRGPSASAAGTAAVASGSDAHLLAAAAPAREPDRPEQRHQPARVLGRDEVQRAAHAPDPGDRALLEAGVVDRRGRRARQPRAHAEGRRGRVLRLQSGDQPHDVGDRCRRPPALGRRAAGRERGVLRARSEGRVRGTAKRSRMTSLQASRTLVKSPPELWAELSELGSLARHLGEFGEIRITKVDPESRVEWEADRASGTVRLEPSGWGTRVVLTVDTPGARGARARARGRRGRAAARAGARARRARAGAVEPEPEPEPSPSSAAGSRGCSAARRRARAGAAAGARRRRARTGARARARAGPDPRGARVRHDRVGDAGRARAEEPSPSPSRSPPTRPTRSSPACSTRSARRTTAPSRAPNTLAGSMPAVISFYNVVLFVHIAAVVLAFGVTFSFRSSCRAASACRAEMADATRRRRGALRRGLASRFRQVRSRHDHAQR